MRANTDSSFSLAHLGFGLERESYASATPGTTNSFHSARSVWTENLSTRTIHEQLFWLFVFAEVQKEQPLNSPGISPVSESRNRSDGLAPSIGRDDESHRNIIRVIVVALLALGMAISGRGRFRRIMRALERMSNAISVRADGISLSSALPGVKNSLS